MFINNTFDEFCFKKDEKKKLMKFCFKICDILMYLCAHVNVLREKLVY